MSNGSSQPFWNRFGGWLRYEPDINNDGAPYRLGAGSRLRLRLRDEINTGSYRELLCKTKSRVNISCKVFFLPLNDEHAEKEHELQQTGSMQS